jgi:ADP-heptose:LPS heptosyltransferase
MYKNWPLDRWTWVCRELRERGIRIMQIGGSGEPIINGVSNCLGAGFVESLGLLANADLHLGGDSWSNHATNIVWEGKGRVTGVILWGSTQATASGYQHNHNISLGLPCQPCFRQPNMPGETRGACPNPPGQTYHDPRHACMHGIDQEHVLEVIVSVYERNQQIGDAPRSRSVVS